jgi:hypothetical protein
MVLLFLSPLSCLSGIAGPDETKNRSGRKVLRLIQIRLATPSFEKSSPARQAQSATSLNDRFEFHKRGQLFIRVHNETLSVAPVRVSDPDCSPFEIQSGYTASTETGFAEIVSDDFPVLYRHGYCLLIILRRLRCRSARFKLCAHLLDLRCLLFELLAELRDGCLQLLYCLLQFRAGTTHH